MTPDPIDHHNDNLKTYCMNRNMSKDYYHIRSYTGKIPQQSHIFDLTRILSEIFITINMLGFYPS